MAGQAPGGPEIVTEGSGWHEQPADRADVDLTYTASARTRTDAVRELGRRVADAEPHLAHAAVQVRHRRLWVHNEWRGKRVVGCRAGQEVSLRITDVAAVEEVLSALIGTEPTGLNGPRWLLDDEAAALREAQKLAVADARHRAEGYAEALGGRVGPLLVLSEAAEHAPMAYRAMAMESGAADSGADVRALGLEPEPVRVSARCTTRWTLITQS
ncbi:SIMPL domain-containing protein [Pseudonocardia lacus]|jgi:uncharacterized protein|uniref:SIMPL domain-containing protein n=1 Tax=Pseudonocardia lacus TaxID=2835865 RepID=UPI001BDC240D|nr:SIMPL domain-containing protein [Pseudonocardia lacus]